MIGPVDCASISHEILWRVRMFSAAGALAGRGVGPQSVRTMFPHWSRNLTAGNDQADMGKIECVYVAWGLQILRDDVPPATGTGIDGNLSGIIVGGRISVRVRGLRLAP